MAKTIVILGASFAGLHVGHYLLKQKNPDFKVIIVSKVRSGCEDGHWRRPCLYPYRQLTPPPQTSHFYWNIASVRAIIPGVLKDEQLFEPLSKALSRYPASAYELIVGTADAADFDARTVTVSPLDGSGIRTISYDQLVLATGSRATDRPGEPEVPWKASGTHEETLALLRDTTSRVASARHVVVAGAGPTGVEIAGELGFEFGRAATPSARKAVVMLASGPEILGGDAIAASARAELAKLGVEVRTEAVVDAARPAADGKTEVLLQNGEKITTDLYLPAMGLTPNSEYVDRKYLDDGNLVKVDEFFRVKGTDGVWALGDIVSKPKAGFMITQKQVCAIVAEHRVPILLAERPA